MRKRIVSTALIAIALAVPGVAQAADTPSLSPIAHGSKAGTTVLSGQFKPGTKVHVDASAKSLEGQPRWLNIDYQVQETGYWCGPAATRIALSARMNPPSQGALAGQLGTTVDGTGWIGQVTSVLNNNLGGGWYETKEMPNDPPAQWQRDLLWNDIVYDIDRNYPVVTNIVAPANNHPPGYPNYTIYHYFTVFGYDPVDRTVVIADPANFGGNAIYWITFDQLASLIPPKGYSA
ncbi:Peptidase_C39 like family protein [Amycolatopsis xylanica]|uniref:Peptidase_C39 like family protein n=1 Tax=Amycolatopsis xylanica TaxID=589385 RepID=A0A1H3H2M0_9PSEU|nr:C39 family peptidase [Amycolatopsis xylanica]SDY09833.1 Peptidase_C39 like family protein [Amycolatopsis xylanica]